MLTTNQYLLHRLILNGRYYEGLQRCLGLYSENGQYSSDEIDRLEALYVSLSKQYNRSSAVKVMSSLPSRSSFSFATLASLSRVINNAIEKLGSSAFFVFLLVDVKSLSSDCAFVFLSFFCSLSDVHCSQHIRCRMPLEMNSFI